MNWLTYLLDLSIALAATLSGILWLQASRGQMRRINASEKLDHHDVNRLVVAFNRAQLLSRRAALATAAAALLGALRLFLSLLTQA